MSRKIENARENLLSHGKEALLSGGYSNLNIKALAAQCGMAVGTYYQYFKNKDDLVLQVVYEMCEAIPANIRKISTSDWSLHRKLGYVYEQFRDYQKNCIAMKIGALRLSGEYESLRKRALAAIDASIVELLEDEIRRGRLELHADPAVAAYLLTHLLLSVGRDADLDFEVIWTCMNFKDLDRSVRLD